MNIQRASAMTTAALAHNYPGDIVFASPIPEMARELTLAWFSVFSWPRNVDLMKNAGIKLHGRDSLTESAKALSDDLRLSVLRVVDALPKPIPTNVGGSQGPIGVSPSCVNPPPRVFDNMGDY